MKTSWLNSGFMTGLLAVQAWLGGSGPLESAAPVLLNPKTVTASSGPIKLVLQVANTKVREDDSLWVRLTLMNVGPRPMKVPNEAFWDVLDLAENGPLRIEVRNKRSGKSVVRLKREDILWTDELDRCLGRYEEEHPCPERPRVWVVKPGEGISTPAKPPSSVYALRSCEKDPEPRQFPPYGEIPGWDWSEPSYEVRAVYDDRPSPKFEKHLTAEGRRNRDYMILVETSWIPLVRLP